MADDLHSLAAAYVLDALDDDERRRFEDHLADCAECTVDVADLSDAAGLLGEGTPLVSPPPDLKAAVMAQIAATPQLPGVDATSSAGAVAPVEPAAPSPSSGAERRRRTGPPRWVTLAAAAAVVVVAGVGAAVVFGGGDDPAQDPTELAIDQVREAPDAVSVELQGAGPGAVTVTYSAADGRGVIVAEGLDAPDSDHVYQLWAISGETPIPLVVFTPEDGSSAEEIEMTFDPPDAWAVTVEPAGGSPKPTGDIVYQGMPA